MTTATLQIHHGNDKHTPIVVGVPLPADAEAQRGTLVHFSNGARSPAQATPLTPATPGGFRWWELSFLSQGTGEASVVLGDADTSPPTAALATQTEGGVVLDNGRVRAVFSTESADAPVGIAWGDGNGALRPEVVTQQFGLCRERPESQRGVAILRNGPVRAQVELTGVLSGFGAQLDYRLTLEMWQDLPALRVDWMITNRIPDMLDLVVQRATLHGSWDAGENTARVFRQRTYGSLGKPRDVRNPDSVDLVADDSTKVVHVSDPTMLRDDADYPFYLAPPTVETADWLELCGDRARVSARVVDFAETRPNMLSSANAELSYHMVPPDSSFTWPQGRRKQQHLLLAFAAATGNPEPEALAATASATFAAGRALPSPQTLRHHGCFDIDRILEYKHGAGLRMNALLSQLCGLISVANKWDLGDTPDWHYTRGYGLKPKELMLVEGAKKLPRKFATGGGTAVFPDVFKYFLEPVWTNNEYDAIHTLGIEVMRTGRDSHFQMLRWAARHNVEVDFLSYSDDPWHHRASPFHSHFHNRKGAITSHFWTQGILQYYCLTGDRDMLETAGALGDKIIVMNGSDEVRDWQFDREIGWALLALTCLAEAGYTQYLDEAGRIADFLQNYDRSAFKGRVKLSAGKAGRSLERQMIDNAFGYASMIEGLDRYDKLAGTPTTTAWLEELLHDLKEAFWQKIDDGERVTARSMVGLMMAVGHERTGDDDFLQAGRVILECYLDPVFRGERGVPAAAGTEEGQAKPCAMAYRGLHRLLGALKRTGQLTPYEYATLRKRNPRPE